MANRLPLRASILAMGFGMLLCSETFLLHTWAQEILTPKKPIPSLVNAQTIYLHTQATKAGAQINSQPITRTITRRLTDVGYQVVTDITAPHDVRVTFHCEEPSPTHSSSDGSIAPPFPISTPPCFFHYEVDAHPVDWQRIDLIIYNEGIRAAEALNPITTISHSMAQALPLSIRYLEILDFPMLLSAEWGQVARMMGLLESAQTSLQRRKKIVSLIGEIQAQRALPRLFDLLHHPTLRLEATQALGHFGAQAQKPLISILNAHEDISMQAAAAKSLGHIGATTGDTSLTPLYLDLLAKKDLNIHVTIEVVWAIGKSPDFGAHRALEALEREIWMIRSDEPELQKLREAVDWSIREVRQGGHTGAYN